MHFISIFKSRYQNKRKRNKRKKETNKQKTLLTIMKKVQLGDVLMKNIAFD